MKIYVASSWNNIYYPHVITTLREKGYEVYDFRKDGFSWDQIDSNWKKWKYDELKYLEALEHSEAVAGFDRDMKALRECDVCVYVMPCGVSASLEAGWARGAGKFVIIYVPELRDIDLMVKMAHLVTADIHEVIEQIHEWEG